jgi:hypothetical protein
MMEKGEEYVDIDLFRTVPVKYQVYLEASCPEERRKCT